jgi:DNA polymerase alpha subunit B
LEYHHSKVFQKGNALKVITAAGPFTTSDSLNFAPLMDLIRRVVREKPDLLILVGPFVDCTQPLLSSGEVRLGMYDDEDNLIGSHGASYEMTFVTKIIRDGLSVLFNSEDEHGTIPTNIIMVPSLQDAHHESVFPQPPFGDRDEVKTSFFSESLGVLEVPFSKDGDPRKRVHLMPNPCMFRVNEVLFGVTSQDMLFALSSDEVSLNTPNRLDRLAAHLLQQQSFCPQFPVAGNTPGYVDLRHSRHWQMKVSPDVLILPSKLTPMARDVLGTVVINPGLLTKGVNGGTFAELNIHPLSEKMLRDKVLEKSGDITHSVHERTYANIIKI